MKFVEIKEPAEFLCEKDYYLIEGKDYLKEGYIAFSFKVLTNKYSFKDNGD